MRGALRLRSGGRGSGVRGETGARAARGPQGSGPCWQRILRGAPGAQVKDGEGGEGNPFVLPAPHCCLLRAAGPHLPPPPPLPRRPRPAKVAAGRGPGAGGGRGRAGHFLCPAALPRAPLPPSPPPPPIQPAGHPRPGRTFRVGRTKKKVSQEGLARARPGQRGPSAAQRQSGRRGLLLLLALRGAGRTRAAEGKRLSFSLARSSQQPGASWAEALGKPGALGPFSGGKPRGRLVAWSPRSVLVLEAASPGARRGRRRQR